MTDLAAFDVATPAEEGAWMDILNPMTGVPLSDTETGEKISIRLAGSYSKKFLDHQRTVQNRRLNSVRRNKMKLTAEELEAESVELIVACTLDWRNIVIDGVKVPHSVANARKLYSDARLRFVRDQADAFIADESNFQTPSAS